MRIFFTSFLLFTVFCCFSQEPKLQTRSDYTYVYKLLYEQSRKIHKGNSLSGINEQDLTFLADSFPTGEKIPDLPTGDYLLASAKGNQAVIECYSSSRIIARLLNNHTDFILLVNDRQGNPVKDAVVKFDGKLIPWSENSHSYFLENFNRKGFLEIHHPRLGNLFFRVDRSWDSGLLLRSIGKIVIQKPASFISKKLGRSYHGYLVFNKPKYLPKDTVKLKAYLVKNNKPVSVPLTLTLEPGNGEELNLAELKPQSPGAYLYEFVLSDTLDIDQYYKLVLRNARGRNKFYVQNVFLLEDYQLDEAVYELRMDQSSFYLSDTVILYISSEDANGLPLQDGKAELTLSLSEIADVYESEMYLDFSLWKHEQKLDPSGETKIIIPDSVFPNAFSRMQLKAKLSNSNYEVQEKEITFLYNKKKSERLEAEAGTTTIAARLIEGGKEISSRGKMLTFPGEDVSEISFPYEEELNPYISEYHFIHGKKQETVYLRHIPHLVEAYTRRTPDSTIFILNNPRRLDIRYTVYRNKKKIDTGMVKDLSLKYADKKKNDYSVSLQFVWAGFPERIDRCICHDTKKLNVKIYQPEQVIPGERKDIEIEVTDYLNRPVKNVNLTAFSLNSQLGEAEIPDIRYGSMPRYSGKHINYFSLHKTQFYSYSNNLHLDLTYSLRKKLLLDRQAFYQILSPGPEGFFYTHPAEADQTQFAPFLYENGKALTIFMIQVDGKVIFFDPGQSEPHYSFPVTPGYHSVTLRTYDREVFLEKVYFEPNRKFFFSYDLKNISDKVKVTKIKKRLTEEETESLHDKFILFETSRGPAYLKQGNRIYFVRAYSYTNLVGPFEEGPIEVYSHGRKKYIIPRSQSLSYGISYPDSLIADTINPDFWKKRWKNVRVRKYNKYKTGLGWYNHLAYTQKDIDNLFFSQPYQHRFNKRNFYTKEGNGSFFLADAEDLPRGEMILFNETDSFAVYNDNPVWYNLSPGIYSFHYFRSDTLVYSLDDINIQADKLLVKKSADSIDFYFKDADGEQPQTYERSGSGRPFYYREKHLLKKVYNPFYFEAKHLLTFDLIPDIYGVRPSSSFGLSAKASFFHGDSESSNMYPGFGIHYRNKFLPRLSMRKELSYARTGGTSIRDVIGVFPMQPLEWRNDLWQYSASLLVDLIPVRKQYSSRPFLNLYGSIGAGLLYSNPKGNLNGKWTSLQNLRTEGKYYPKIHFFIPAGAGMRFKLSRYLDLEADWTYNFTFTDYLDDTGIGNKQKDAFSLVSIRFNYSIPQRVVCPRFRTDNSRSSYMGLAYFDYSYLDENQTHVSDFASVQGVYSFHAMDEVELSAVVADKKAGGIKNYKVLVDDGYLNEEIYEGAEYIYGETIKGQVMQDNLVESDILSAFSSGFIRKDFRDYAYWQPNLITNDSGRASFSVSFPGNITRWNSYVLAMNGRQSGKGFASTRAFKPLMSSLYIPRFLIEGDEVFVNGKSLNYTSDTLSIKTFFKIGDDTTAQNESTIVRVLSERQRVIAKEKDTLTVEYFSKLSNDYTDGEERTIPVFRKGVEESKGIFLLLSGDTSFTIDFDTSLGRPIVWMEHNTMDVLLKEIQHVQEYPYYCMEQAASKLDVLLMKKNIYEQLKQPFRENHEIRALIRKLQKGQKADGTWGWWEDAPSHRFITLHILKVLEKANSMGFTVDYNRNAMKFFRYFDGDKYELRALQLKYLNNMSDLRVPIDYKKIIDSAETLNLSLHERIELLRLKQIHKLDYNLQELLKEKKETLLGSIYWGEEGFDLFGNAVQTTSLVYDILKREGGYENELLRIRNYFMEQRRNGYWNNTYESATILETILPDVLKETSDKTPEVTVNNKLVDRFPYKEELTGNSLAISQKGTPVYFTAYQKDWNKDPQKKNEGFQVETKLMVNGKVTDSLTAGQTSLMYVTVKNEKAGRYVMIEIPIPAGCSYDSRTFALNAFEIHREYFKDKVVIFCEELPTGVHEFSLMLQPRFSGSFTLNPAKAELMYYPVFYGRNGLKKTVITE